MREVGESARPGAPSSAATAATDDESAPPLFHAVVRGSVQEVRTLLESGASTRAVYERGETPLHYAAFRGDLEIVELLVQYGACIDSGDQISHTPLFRAVEGGHQQVVTWLVAQGASVDRREYETGTTTLFRAAEAGDLEMVKLLVRLGAAIEFENLGYVADAEAEMEWEDVEDEEYEEHVVDKEGKEDESYNDEEEANDKECEDEQIGAEESDGVEWEDDEEEEIKEDGEVDAEEANNEDHLDDTDERSGSEGGEVETEEGEKVYGDGDNSEESTNRPEVDDGTMLSALIGAAKRNQLHVAKWLIEQGASVDLFDDFTCALVCAAQEGHVDMARLLLANGASASSKNDRGRTPLFFAAYNGDEELLQLLLQHGAWFDELDGTGRTPLSFAAREGNVDMVKLLVANGALVDEKDTDGKTALFGAAEEGLKDMMTLLLQLGAAIDLKDSDGKTALFCAALEGDEAVVKHLLDHGASVEEEDTIGMTALAAAAKAGKSVMVNFLLRNSASTETTDNRGWTPLLAAAEKGWSKIVDALISSGANVNHVSQANETALIVAGRQGHFDIFKTLIAAGSSVNVRAQDAETPLISAARWDVFSGVQLLITHGGSIGSVRSKFEVPLIPGTLMTMEAWCSDAGEFKQMFEHAVKRLQDACSQMQAVDVDQATLTSFAAITFRLCRLQFKRRTKCLVLQFTSSRATSAHVQNFHEEMDNFIAQSGLDTVNVIHADWKQLWEADWKQQLKDFEESLRDDVALLSGLDEQTGRINAVAQLQYELQNRSGVYTDGDLRMISQVTSRVQQASGLEDAVVPWFISLDDIEIDLQTLDADDTGAYNSGRESGTWLKTSVTISSSETKVTDFEQNASRWFPLSHPNVVKLYGACHTSQPTFFVYEAATYDSLLSFLRLEGNRRFTWMKLLEVARGLQYLHQRGIAHGDLRCDSILLGSDLSAKIAGFGEREVSITDNIDWKSAELIRGEAPSLASDIYAFGISILEATALTKPWPKNAYIEVVMDTKSGRPPPRPSGLDTSVWDFVKKMCTYDPGERVKIAYVVQQLDALAAGGSLDERQAKVIELARVDLRSFPFLKLGGTVESALHVMKAAAANFPESQQLAEQVLAKIVELYGRLLEMEKSPTDFEVTKFCEVLSRFQWYLRTPASEISVTRFARSRKIADSNHVFRADLDRLMDVLLVPELDPLRVWGSEFETINEEESVELMNKPEVEQDGTQSSEAITLVNFGRVPIPEDALDPNSPVDSNDPSWLLPLSELVFEETDCIGEGAFGAVYKGAWLDTPVVVKFMGYKEDHGKSSTRLFLHEVSVWHQLSHPHIVKLYGASHVGKRYFVCEYASNGSLLEYLKLPENTGRKWQKLYETALGLEYLHGLNVIHNDLKCDNILVGADGRAKLIDFGLSSIPNVAEIQVDVKQMGALHWKSPEYLAGERPASTSDIYSLAMCILEVVTGDIPWGRKMSPVMVKLQVKKGRLPPRPDAMDAAQWNLFELMTKHDPKQRVKIALVVDKLREIAVETSSMRIP